MKRVLTSILVLPLLLSGAAQAPADSSSAAPAATPVVRSNDAGAVGRKSYVELQAAILSQWRQRIAEFNEHVETKTTGAGQAAKREIESSWAAVEQASSKLVDATEDSWLDARTAYERATRALEATWVKFDPSKT